MHRRENNVSFENSKYADFEMRNVCEKKRMRIHWPGSRTLDVRHRWGSLRKDRVSF